MKNILLVKKYKSALPLLWLQPTTLTLYEVMFFQIRLQTKTTYHKTESLQVQQI